MMRKISLLLLLSVVLVSALLSSPVSPSQAAYTPHITIDIVYTRSNTEFTTINVDLEIAFRLNDNYTALSIDAAFYIGGIKQTPTSTKSSYQTSYADYVNATSGTGGVVTKTFNTITFTEGSRKVPWASDFVLVTCEIEIFDDENPDTALVTESEISNVMKMGYIDQASYIIVLVLALGIILGCTAFAAIFVKKYVLGGSADVGGKVSNTEMVETKTRLN